MISLSAPSRLQKRPLRFWKDVDPDIPILQHTEAEYAKLS
jgi:hypothetical protein